MNAKLTSLALKWAGLPLILAICLFGGSSTLLFNSFLGPIPQHFLAAARDPHLQWVMLLCGSFYFILFALIRPKQLVGSSQRVEKPTLWLATTLLVGGLDYAVNYPIASQSTQALTLLTGATLGRGLALWQGKRENFTSFILYILALLLFVASFFHSGIDGSFEYRSQTRWTGLWDNPNIFGMLMGTGVVLTAGRILQTLRWKMPHRRWKKYSCLTFFYLAAILMARGLLHSYSRGAWIGTLCGLTYIAIQWFKVQSPSRNRAFATENQHAETGSSKTFNVGQKTCDSWSWYTSWFEKNWFPVSVILCSVIFLLFWQSDSKQRAVAGRVFSVTNVNDFSWRNRVVAWEGALQIMAENPWLGAGWNRPEILYDNYYLPTKVNDGAAIQMNDYLALGAALGFPALVCFGLYIWLAFVQKSQIRGGESAVAPKSAIESDWLRAICRAGAIVLAIGFWFDGGLFTLATASTFWILLELGRRNLQRKTPKIPVPNPVTRQACGIKSQAVSLLLARKRYIGWLSVVPVFVILLFFGTIFWSERQDPFSRKWFTVPAPLSQRSEGRGQRLEEVKCVAVLPKPIRRCPVVIYAHGFGGSLMDDGNDLRQMAKLGLATVSLEYDQTNEISFATQFEALLQYVQHQKWADTNEIAWVGFSMGANRILDFALQNSNQQPKQLVLLSGNGLAPRFTLHLPFSFPKCPVLLIHGAQDDILPMDDTKSLALCLQSNDVPVDLRIIPNARHNMEPDRKMVLGSIGECCLTQLAGTNVWRNYHSPRQWEAEAPPFWLFCIPAATWAVLYFAWSRWGRGVAFTEIKSVPESSGRVAANQAKSSQSRLAPAAMPSQARAGCKWPGIALRWLAAILALCAIAVTVVHLLPTYFAVTEKNLIIARKELVPPKERADFEFLAAQPIWHGVRLETLLTHAKLANYNRELINWPLDNKIYRDYVLSPVIMDASGERAENQSRLMPAATEPFSWRRPLWEEFYPLIRHENSPEDAAAIVVRHLRECTTIASIPNPPHKVPDIWLRQITDKTGFQIIYVAALRSIGVPARLNAQQQAEFFDGTQWGIASAPAVVSW